jgi:hypothetical protein
LGLYIRTLIRNSIRNSIRTSIFGSIPNALLIPQLIILIVIFIVPATAAYASAAHLVATPETAATAPVARSIVIGFVGGFVRHDDVVHSVVQVAARLRRDYPSDVYIEVIENHHGEKAFPEIIRLLDTDHNGTLSAEEKKTARIILYGHSWGASESVTLARQLEKEGIPVLLTVQVDSVPKPGENDKVIPANVAEAVNFYQLNGFLHGEPEISAADPARTHILGNFRFDYKGTTIDCKEYPWYNRVFMKAHTQIECDSKVWTQVEALIRSRLASQHQ